MSIEKEKIKVGLLVWWRAERYSSGWSCPCIVIRADKKHFRVMSLDDFKETNDLRLDDRDPHGKSGVEEMRICSIDEIREYFKKRDRKFEDGITELNRKLKDTKEEQEDFRLKSEKFLEECKQ